MAEAQMWFLDVGVCGAFAMSAGAVWWTGGRCQVRYKTLIVRKLAVQPRRGAVQTPSDGGRGIREASAGEEGRVYAGSQQVG